jgi:hypothetical protein
LFLVKAASNRSEGSKWDFRNYILLINKELLEDKAEQPIWSRSATKKLVTFWMVASLSNKSDFTTKNASETISNIDGSGVAHHAGVVGEGARHGAAGS